MFFNPLANAIASQQTVTVVNALSKYRENNENERKNKMNYTISYIYETFNGIKKTDSTNFEAECFSEAKRTFDRFLCDFVNRGYLQTAYLVGNGEILYEWSCKDDNSDDNSADEESSEREFTVTVRIEGRYSVHVKAKTAEDAIKVANNTATEADFGDLSDIEWGAVTVEDEENGAFQKL